MLFEITSNIKLPHVRPMLSEVEIRSRISIPTEIWTEVFSNSNYSPNVFSNIDKSAKEIPIFQNSFNCAIEKLPPNL